MKMFVFEGVLADYTDGMAMIAAKNLDQAQQLAFEQFGYQKSIEEFLAKEPGVFKPAGEYPLRGGSAGVLHYVYGGG